MVSGVSLRDRVGKELPQTVQSVTSVSKPAVVELSQALRVSVAIINALKDFIRIFNVLYFVLNTLIFHRITALVSNKQRPSRSQSAPKHQLGAVKHC